MISTRITITHSLGKLVESPPTKRGGGGGLDYDKSTTYKTTTYKHKMLKNPMVLTRNQQSATPCIGYTASTCNTTMQLAVGVGLGVVRLGF